MSPISPAPEEQLWHELHFLAPPEWEDLLSTWLIEYTGRGVACFLHGNQSEIAAYCPSAEEAEQLVALITARWDQFCAAYGVREPLQVRQRTIQEEDWASSWKDYFHPLRVGQRFVIKPTWEAWPPADDPGAARPEDLIIELDPQMAFGTGTHATTQLCLEALERYLHPAERVADIGSGSGILTIGAALLGCGSVEAWEVDPVAVRIAALNVERNGRAEVCSLHEGDALEKLAGEFDVIVANVHTHFLLQLIPRLPAFLRPGGRVVLSGTTETSAEAIEQALAEAGLELREKKSRGEWVALVGAYLTPSTAVADDRRSGQAP